MTSSPNLPTASPVGETSSVSPDATASNGSFGSPIIGESFWNDDRAEIFRPVLSPLKNEQKAYLRLNTLSLNQRTLKTLKDEWMISRNGERGFLTV